MASVTTAYYLVHSMGSTQSFEDQDRVAAQNFANAARAAGVHRIIYLSCLGQSTDELSARLPIRKIGGARGWYNANWLWQLRGWLYNLARGGGLRRRRRDVDALQVGDTVDFWRVEAIEPGQRLRPSAEMKLPGHAWLEFEVTGDSAGCLIRQTATFDARGVLGRAYWYSVCPLHEFVFSGMLRAIAARAGTEN